MNVPATVWLVRLLGRFHPTVVHFPIAFLLVAAALELLGMLRKKPVFPEALFFSLSAGAVGAIVTAALGWADAASLRFGPEDAVALAVHRWLGTFTAACSIGAWLLRTRIRAGKVPRLESLSRAALFASAVTVGVGAHFGGILVYGHDYFTSALSGGEATPRASPGRPSPPPPPGEIRFERDIRPLFEQRCVRCHGPRKGNARLRLDSREAALAGGKSGPAVRPGDAAHSPLYLAITDPDPATRMPQEAPALPEKEIGLVRAWIDQGAP